LDKKYTIKHVNLREMIIVENKGEPFSIRCGLAIEQNGYLVQVYYKKQEKIPNFYIFYFHQRRTPFFLYS